MAASATVGSDYARVVRQQTVFAALVDKVTELGWSDYPSVIQQMMPYCETSLDLSDVMGLAPILLTDFSISSISVPNVEYETDLFDGLDSYSTYHMIYDTLPARPSASALSFMKKTPPIGRSTGDTSAGAGYHHRSGRQLSCRLEGMNGNQ